MMTNMERLADREHLPVEIALLLSLLLHAMAISSWQYRAELGRLPVFSTLLKLMQAAYLQPSVAHPQMQTITFVEINEPRAPAQPQKSKETKTFMETDASQVTGEKPKNAQYYSDKSTVAANPKNPSGKTGETPYLEGKETHVMNTVDVPTPSGVLAPLIVQPGAPGAPGPVAPPQVAQAAPQEKPPASPLPQSQTPAQSQEVAPVGVKIMEEQKMAQLQPEPTAVRGSDVAVPPATAEAGEGGAPAVVTEPGVPGRELVTRKSHLVAAGVSRTGVAAFNVEESPFGAYDKKVVKAIQSRWYQLIDRYGIYESTATVTVYFQLFDDGQVKNVKTTEGSENSILSLFCEKAILESGPFDPWPESLRVLVGKQPREASITFYY
jgi:hypothetical protein